MRQGYLVIRVSTSLIILFIINACTTSTEKSPVATHIIEIRQMQFQPSEIVAHKGDTVVFINKDILVHDVTEKTSKNWNSNPLSSGDHYKLVAQESSNYYCSIHPVMKGRILVQ